jgi:hypothetical protein
LKKIIKDANFLSRKSKKKIIPEKPYLIWKPFTVPIQYIRLGHH